MWLACGNEVEGFLADWFAKGNSPAAGQQQLCWTRAAPPGVLSSSPFLTGTFPEMKEPRWLHPFKSGFKSTWNARLNPTQPYFWPVSALRCWEQQALEEAGLSAQECPSSPPPFSDLLARVRNSGWLTFVSLPTQRISASPSLFSPLTSQKEPT